ncbi:hypothetical protein [Acrocarpospora catenulata]|uniref:hypothetical protein n=1 Tax=Acrocarpospora catenulata TaxID=2836182 RepID=UPI001BDA1FB9|nr:hypothetical protein [Acrocarpospora catenulata]
MNRLAVAGWLAAVVAATAAGVAVTNGLTAAVAGSSVRPLTSDQVRQALAIPVTTTPQPGPAKATPSADNPSAEESQVFATSGGTAVAACTGGQARLLSWTPAQGYQVDDVDPGPDDHVKVKFEADDSEVEIEIRCSGGIPVAREKIG